MTLGSSGGTTAMRNTSLLNQTIDPLPYARYHVYAFANPRSGDGLAAGFLTDFPHKNVKQLWFEEKQQTVACIIRFYNVTEAQERNKCLSDIEAAMRENDNSTRKTVCMMGGDGSLATTIKFLRTS